MSFKPRRKPSRLRVPIGSPTSAPSPSAEIAASQDGSWPDEAELIAQAQESIDRRALSDGGETVEDGEFAALSRTLQAWGGLGVSPFAEPAPQENPPVRLGRFQVRSEIGRGGFGVVFRAYDELLKREVALKIPRPDRLLSGQSPDAFIREAQLAARLDHPGIVRVYDAGCIGPVWYIASALYDGPTLSDLLGTGLSARASAELMAQVADAVHCAHSRGVLHLDLKPANVLLAPPDAGAAMRPMVTDFGLSSLRDAGQDDQSPRVAGTPAYMAPEQRSGDVAKIGVATDVYALGAMLLELLSDPTSEGPPPPRDLQAVCRRCLAPEPDQRYGSALEVATDLRRFLDGLPVLARNLSPLERAGRWIRRRPAVVALLLALAFTLVGSFLSVWHHWREAEAHLARFREERAVHAQTSERLGRSLLDLTWTLLESRLLRRADGQLGDSQIDFVHKYYDSVRNWQAVAGDNPQLEACLSAAEHSLRMVYLAEHDPVRREAEFLAGLDAWESVVRLAPTTPRWRRGMALHVLTYCRAMPNNQWLWWRSSSSTGIGRETAQFFEEDYARLLIEYAETSSNYQAQSMLQAAVVLLEEMLPQESRDEQQLANLIAACARLSRLAERVGLPDVREQAVNKAVVYAAEAGPAKICSAPLAEPASEVFRMQARWLHQHGDPAKAQAANDRALAYIQRAIELAPDNARLRIASTTLHDRGALLAAAAGQSDVAVTHYLTAAKTLGEGVQRNPVDRALLRRRARVTYRAAELLLKADRPEEARKHIETCVRDYEALGLRPENSWQEWSRAIRAWQTLGRLYAAENRQDEAVVALQKSLALLEQVSPARREKPQYFQYLALSQSWLDQANSGSTQLVRP